MVTYSEITRKNLEKGIPPIKVFNSFFNAFASLDLTKDITIFDIKKLVGETEIPYLRLRKGKYRAIFHYEENGLIVVDYINKREEVYKWLVQ